MLDSSSSAARTRAALCALLIVALTACTPTPPPTPAPRTDLSGIKTYLLDKAAALKAHTATLKDQSARYYTLAEAAHFDYAALWGTQATEAQALVQASRTTWMQASPLYEQMEGIVAGTPSLAAFDVALDAGTSGTEDPASAVPFDLHLPDGSVLPKPGNLFGVTESALWGTFPAYTAPGVTPDFDGDGQLEFGEALPEAGVLKAAAELLAQYASDLETAAQAWTPSESDAFTALVVMIPTMSEYFASWKHSRFVAGTSTTQRDFVAISRLADMQDILGSLSVIYTQIKPLVASVDSAQALQIEQDLHDLHSFVANIYTQEQSGKRFTPEEADVLSAEAQNRATAIAGQIAQMAAKLNISVEDSE